MTLRADLNWLLMFCFAVSGMLFAQTTIVPAPVVLKPGAVVENVTKNFAGQIAGLEIGDVLSRWKRGTTQGEIRSPFDLTTVEIEQAPRRTVTLIGVRGVEKKRWVLEPGTWGITTRPAFLAPFLPEYDAGRELESAGNHFQASSRWNALADRVETMTPPWLRPWLLLRIAEEYDKGQQWKSSEAKYQQALESAQTAGIEVQTQLLRSFARHFERRSIWAKADEYFEQAAAKERRGNGLTLALDLDSIGRVARRQGNVRRAEAYYREALKIRKKIYPHSLAFAASLNNMGDLEEDKGSLADAEYYCRKALAIRERLAPGSLDLAASFLSLANLSYDRSDMVGAELNLRRALDIREKLLPGSIEVAATLNNLGNIAYVRGKLPVAQDYYLRALEIKKRVSPASLSEASTLANLGNVALGRGYLIRAEDYYRQDMEITRKLAPDSLDFAGSLMDLGIVAQDRGDLDHAEEYYRQALDIKKRIAPNSLTLAFTLNNLGTVASDRRDLVRAEEYYRQSLEIREQAGSVSLDVAQALDNLAGVALERDDLRRAENYGLQALKIKEKLAPGSLDDAATLDLLGMIHLKRKDVVSAERFCRRAFAIREKSAPVSLDAALSLDNLGTIAWRGGDFPMAQQYLQRALAIREKLAPESVDTARTLNLLSAILKGRGDLSRAEEHYRRALKIWEKLAPASADEADSLTGLASVMRKRGQLNTADQLYEGALTALEGQAAQMGGAEDTRAGFRAKHLEPYREYIDLLVKQNRPDLALQTLERYRARTLLETLAMAGVDLQRGTGSSLLAKERSLRSDIQARSERRLQLLSHEHSNETVKAIENEISDLTLKYHDLEAQIRVNNPGYAALTQPQPLTTQEIQDQLLDPETLLLEYDLGAKRSYVFVVTPKSLDLHELPRRSTIERAAQRVYRLLTAPNRRPNNETNQERESRLSRAAAEYPEAAARLSRMILGPVSGEIHGKRLLIVCDGLLQYVPFAALPMPTSGNVATLLVAQHEIVLIPSASALAVLRMERASRKETPAGVAVLADPVFDQGDVRVKSSFAHEQKTGVFVSAGKKDQPLRQNEASRLEQLTRSATDIGWRRGQNGEVYLPRLPFTRREAEEIAAVTPHGELLEALDFNASRATATSPDLRRYRILHFATHALVNNKHPELSGLVLSLVNQQGMPQNGFLDLEDIYNLKLSADLVVLSACETGLGKEIEGEGLLGLTRGFMYAGANRVVGSLWKIDDSATAKLVGLFYRAMEEQKMSPAAALREAQLEIARQKQWSSPYFWAAFQIYGEWK